MTAFLDAALEYAELGWPVFPLAPRSKMPLIAKDKGGNGFYDASTNKTVIRNWWRRCPTANIGIRTGINCDVVDIDSIDALAHLILLQGDEPTTNGPAVATAKGWHMYFKPSGRRRHPGFLPRVDYLGTDGYVIAPPSIHPDGGRYEWAEVDGIVLDHRTPLDPVPAWILDMVPTEDAGVARIHQEGLTPPGAAAPGRRASAYAQRALEAEVGRVLLAPVGQRNDQLNRSAFSLGQLVAGGALDAEHVVRVLLEAAVRAGLAERESEASIASGMAGGMRSPRSVPV